MSWYDPVIQGCLSGLGSAVGSYIATRYVVEHFLKPLEKKKEEAVVSSVVPK